MIAADAIIVGFGGNVGGEASVLERFLRAREAFAEIGDVKSAALYRTAPIGPEQPAFLNSAVRIRWPDATPNEVISTVLEIERLLGRDRGSEARWGPRRIDLDVLVWGTRIVREPGLEVPHPRLVERRFALQPLCDLVGEDTILPGTNDSLGALLQRVSAQTVEQLQSAW